MIKKAFNKNLSIKEQINLIENKFNTNEIFDLNLSNEIRIQNLKKRDRFFCKELTEFEFNKIILLINKIDSFAFYKTTLLDKILELNIKEPKILTLEKDFFMENIFEDIEINSENDLISEKEIEDLILDTSLLNVFYLNKKTINNFSKLLITKEFNIYLLKRGKYYYLFGLIL